MLRLGILDKESFLAGPPSALFARLRYRLSRGRVSMHLLAMPPSPTQQDAEVFEKLMPYIRLANGTYRTTYRQRFRNLNPAVNELLSQNFPPSTELRVEDWAASACLTSSEWARSLFPLFPALRFAASDVLLFLIEVDGSTATEKFIFDPDGRSVQYIRPPFVIRMDPPESWALPLSRLWYLHARRRLRSMPDISALSGSWLDSLTQNSIEFDGCRARKLSLIHPEPVELARTDKRFTIHRQSIFERSNTPCHVIRSMNILNRAYFSEELLAQAARSIIESLVLGGIWILGRTTSEDPPVHEVTIFRKQSAETLEVLQRIGAGSEIESIALAAARPR